MSRPKPPWVYRRREAQALTWLRAHGIRVDEQTELNVCETQMYRFDGASKNGRTVVEVRANDLPENGKLRDTQLAETSEACLYMLGVKKAKRRILALTQRRFYYAFMKTRQACVYQSLGIKIIPTFDRKPKSERVPLR
jgi:hypothetical protein